MVRVEKKALKRALSAHRSGCASFGRTSDDFIRIEYEQDLRLTTMSWFRRFENNVRCESIDGGLRVVVVPANRVWDAVMSLPGDVLELSSSSGGVELSGDASRVLIKGYQGEDDTSLAHELLHLERIANHQIVGMIPSTLLAQMVSDGRDFASTDNARQRLCRVHVEADEEAIEWQATNGHVLIARKRPCPSVWSFKIEIPADLLQFLHRSMDVTENVLVSRTSGVTEFIGHDWRVAAAEPTHTPVDYEEVSPHPDALPNRAVFKRVDGLTAHKAVARFAKQKGASFNITLNGSATVGAEVADNTASAELNAQDIKTADDEFRVSMNPNYFRAAMEAVVGETVDWRASDPLSPMLFQGDNDDTIIVMPMRG